MIFHMNSLAWKPQLVLGAVLAAGVPIGAVAWKSYRTSNATSGHVLADQAGASGVAGKTKVTSSIDAMHSSTNVSSAAPTPSTAANSFGGIQAWFEGSANPFLTTAQAKERKFKDALSKVEAALRRRDDVEDVCILVDESAQGIVAGGFVLKSAANAEKSSGEINEPSRKPKAVVSIRMRQGSLPIGLADSAGSLVSAALVNVNAEDVEVIDERSGARIRAQMLDFKTSVAAREALALTEACEQEEVLHDLQKVLALTNTNQPLSPDMAADIQNEHLHGQQLDLKFNSPSISLDAGLLPQSWWAHAWWWGALLLVLGLVGAIVMWWKRSSRASAELSATVVNARGALMENVNMLQDASPLCRFQFWSAPLACSLHKCVAEKPALIAATLVQRLEGAPSSRQEVAAMMLELEPWAAERVLAVLPNRSLDVLEHAIKNPSEPAAAQQVRALAEAIVSLRNAA